MKRLSFVILYTMLSICIHAQDAVRWGEWQSWGEQTDGTYRNPGNHYTPLGQYQLSWGFYRGDRIGIYCFSERGAKGYIDVDYFHYDTSRQ
ncbi:MAG: hypothetical protein IKO73_01535 [Bacteroidaceae bacterium]|nr:hypothetical protein [Bacteroidaceae bacterium]